MSESERVDGFHTGSSETVAALRYFDIAPLHAEMKNLLSACRNQLDRLWPNTVADPRGGQTMLRSMVAVTDNTYRTVAFLCSDTDENPARKLEYCLSVPPLARSILDTLFLTVYIFNDFSANVTRYHRAGLSEAAQAFERYQSEYGASSEWDDHLRERHAHLKAFAAELGLVVSDAKDIPAVPRWPTPGQMPGDSTLNGERQDFLRYLNAWFYKELSQDDHLSWPGLARRGAALLESAVSGDRRETLVKYRSDMVFKVVTLTLAVLSEIEGHLHYGEAQRLIYQWVLLSDYYLDAKEVYERRYKTLLAFDVGR
jgi:hypothetical protein